MPTMSPSNTYNFPQPSPNQAKTIEISFPFQCISSTIQTVIVSMDVEIREFHVITYLRVFEDLFIYCSKMR